MESALKGTREPPGEDEQQLVIASSCWGMFDFSLLTISVYRGLDWAFFVGENKRQDRDCLYF